VTFVQREDDTIWLPPYCAHAVFTLKTSVLLGPEIFAKHRFPQRLANIGVNLIWEKAANRLGERDGAINILEKHLQEVLGTDDEKLNKEVLEAWDVFDKSGTLSELFKYSGKGFLAEEFLEMWKKEASHWKSCPVCGIVGGKGEEGRRLPRKAKEKHSRWFSKHFEEVHWSLGKKATIKIPAKFRREV
jgi:hypothetical protein